MSDAKVTTAKSGSGVISGHEPKYIVYDDSAGHLRWYDYGDDVPLSDGEKFKVGGDPLVREKPSVMRMHEMSKLGEVIAKIIKEVPDLSKGHTNPHGKFNYVSIDEYYKEVASIAAANGLTWRVREASCEDVGRAKTRTGEQTLFKFTYEFDVILTTGGGEYIISGNFTSFSVIHPYQGPQTSGSAASYADKLFMRTTFKVVTGEPDADAVDPIIAPVTKGAAKELKHKRKPAPKLGKDASNVVKTIVESDDLTALVEFYTAGSPEWDFTKAEDDAINSTYEQAIRKLSGSPLDL